MPDHRPEPRARRRRRRSRLTAGITYPRYVVEQWTARNKVPFGLVSGRAPKTEITLPGRDIAPISFDADAAQRTFLLWIDRALNQLRTALQQYAPVDRGTLRNSQRVSLGLKNLKIESLGFISSELNLEVIVEIVAIEYATWVRRYQNYRRYDNRSGTQLDWLSLSLSNMVAGNSDYLVWEQVGRRK